MSQPVKTTFEIRSWDESPIDETEGGTKLARASVVKAYTGGLEGEGRVEQIACSRPDGSAVFTALERFRGRIGDREGGFVMRHEGTFANGKVDSVWTVIPGSGTGDLADIRGEVEFASGHAPRYDVTFALSFG